MSDDQIPVYTDVPIGIDSSGVRSELLGGTVGSQQPVGPNDAVNMGQSSNDTTLREAALASGKVTAEQFDSIVDPHSMVGNGVAGA